MKFKNFKKREEKLKVGESTPKQLPAHKNPKYLLKKGDRLNPLGRPKGSRNKFGEAFLEDFLTEWEENGKDALRACRIVDPARFCSIAASLLPKELNINEGDSAFDRLIEQFSDEQLEQFISGIMAFGAKQIEA